MWKVAAHLLQITRYAGPMQTCVIEKAIKNTDLHPCITLFNSGFMVTDYNSGTERTDSEHGEASLESGLRPLTREDIPKLVKAMVDQHLEDSICLVKKLLLH